MESGAHLPPNNDAALVAAALLAGRDDNMRMAAEREIDRRRGTHHVVGYREFLAAADELHGSKVLLDRLRAVLKDRWQDLVETRRRFRNLLEGRREDEDPP